MEYIDTNLKPIFIYHYVTTENLLNIMNCRLNSHPLKNKIC